VANSRGMKLESREVGAARLGKRRSVCPGSDVQQVDGSCSDDMLQVVFGMSAIASAAQSTAADRLGMGAFDAGPRCVGLPEFLRCLSLSHRLERFMELTGLQADGARFPASLLCIADEKDKACSLAEKSAFRSPRPMPDWFLLPGDTLLPAGHVTT
jgi:hypothetical protein